MRTLVTGGAGFIGSAIVDQLIEAGHEVVILDSIAEGAHRCVPAYLNSDAEFIHGDVRDAKAAADAVAGVDAVFHEAGMVGLGVDFADAPGFVENNDSGTAVLLEALHCNHFAGPIVLASSMVIYGEGAYRCDTHGPVRPAARKAERMAAGDYECHCPECDAPLGSESVTEDAYTDPRNVYAATKLHQEHLAAAYGREHGTSVVALRYHNVYGPRMPRSTPYSGVAAIFRSAAERGEAPAVYEDGKQMRDFVHVSDVARANLAALNAFDRELPTFSAYNIGSGEPHTVLEMAEALVAAIPGAPQPQVVGGFRTGDVRHVFASSAKAAKELGFIAEVGFEIGMAELAVARLRE